MEVTDIKENMSASLVKVTNCRFGNDHPKGVNEGDSIKGFIYRFNDAVGVMNSNGEYIRTSRIQSIEKDSKEDKKFIIKTLNSIYNLTIF